MLALGFQGTRAAPPTDFWNCAAVALRGPFGILDEPGFVTAAAVAPPIAPTLHQRRPLRTHPTRGT